MCVMNMPSSNPAAVLPQVIIGTNVEAAAAEAAAATGRSGQPVPEDWGTLISTMFGESSPSLAVVRHPHWYLVGSWLFVLRLLISDQVILQSCQSLSIPFSPCHTAVWLAHSCVACVAPVHVSFACPFACQSVRSWCWPWYWYGLGTGPTGLYQAVLLARMAKCLTHGAVRGVVWCGAGGEESTVGRGVARYAGGMISCMAPAVLATS
jgi:hypothetical protein